jgi:hypothetical protein
MVEGFEQDHASGRFLWLQGKGTSKDRRQHKPTFLIDAATKLTREHIASSSACAALAEAYQTPNGFVVSQTSIFSRKKPLADK